MLDSPLFWFSMPVYAFVLWVALMIGRDVFRAWRNGNLRYQQRRNERKGR